MIHIEKPGHKTVRCPGCKNIYFIPYGQKVLTCTNCPFFIGIF